MRIATTLLLTPSYTDAVAGATALNVAGAARYARTLPEGSTVVTILCDGGDRYRSRLWNATWLAENDCTPFATDLSFL